MDWSNHVLGPPEGWPDALKQTLGMLFHTRQPMLVFWGPELIEFYNDAYIPIHGVTKHPSAMGRPGAEVWPEIWDQLYPQIRDVFEHGRASWHQNQRLDLSRGGRIEETYFTYSYSPVYEVSGRVVATLVICSETTSEVFSRRALERAQSQAEMATRELHGIFEQAPLPMCLLTGPDLVFSLANQAYAELVGRPVEGRPLREVFTAAELEHYLPQIEHVLRTGEPLLNRETPLELTGRDPAQGAQYIDAGYYPYHHPDGAITGVLVVVHDVTHQVLSRHRVERLAQELQAAVETRDEFLSIASHELRTPITTMKIHVQSAQHAQARLDLTTPEGARLAKMTEAFDRGIHRLTRLVSDMLDVARVQTGKLQVQLHDHDIIPLLRETLDRFSGELAVANVALTTELPAHLPLRVDPVRLEQVFTNLITNALRYASGAPLRVAASTENGVARIVFEDRGPGIAAAHHDRIFERFERNVSSSEASGLGLGLFISRELAAAHGGRLLVESELGRGTAFILELPVPVTGHLSA